jgi:hypothetical protein
VRLCAREGTESSTLTPLLFPWRSPRSIAACVQTAAGAKP